MKWGIRMKSQKDHRSCIGSVPIFKNLNTDEMREVKRIASHGHLDKGHIIFRAGNTLNDLYVIDQGRVKIARYTSEGKEQVIRILSSGDFFGELTLFNDETTQSFAEVLEPTIICYLEGNQLKALMDQNPAILFKMMRELSKRLEKAETMIEYNNLRSSEAKLAKLLLELSKDATVRFHTTKGNLASNLGIKPETFSRKLKGLRDKGLIEIIDNKTVRILDEIALSSIIDHDG